MTQNTTKLHHKYYQMVTKVTTKGTTKQRPKSHKSTARMTTKAQKKIPYNDDESNKGTTKMMTSKACDSVLISLI
ncbi:hypothetical protein C2G38_2211149 [Gigaspora rosea]|uniref:Uncharacterized protein n=1 Tax=Gigaspora rosea TaxID=44941 RepID=A0A397UEM4_9GLOM|nr:hypothetical protein C2G38_2211149 [Gigaspora rosea]